MTYYAGSTISHGNIILQSYPQITLRRSASLRVRILPMPECPGANYSEWPKVCHNVMTMPGSREAHRK